MEELYPCPGCGSFVFDEPSGSYDICPLCDWEDDSSQLRYPMSEGGANKQSLHEHQQFWLQNVPSKIRERNGFRRDPLWRPFRIEEYYVPDHLKMALDWFKVTDDDPPYYWRTANTGKEL